MMMLLLLFSCCFYFFLFVFFVFVSIQQDLPPLLLTPATWGVACALTPTTGYICSQLIKPTLGYGILNNSLFNWIKGGREFEPYSMFCPELDSNLVCVRGRKLVYRMEGEMARWYHHLLVVCVVSLSLSFSLSFVFNQPRSIWALRPEQQAICS